MEALREFEVVTNSYDVTEGRQASGSVKAVTKSGTNQFHGSAFAYFWDARLGADKNLRGQILKVAAMPSLWVLMICDSTGLANYDKDGQMKNPGFKVLHVQDIYFNSHCKTFEQALGEIKQWSDQHPNHYPIYITVNAKEEPPKFNGGTTPEEFIENKFDLLDKEILKFLGESKLLTPDYIRGSCNTLNEAVSKKNWPRLQEAKGKFLFILDENDQKRSLYKSGHPSLKGRAIFMNAEAGEPEAAILIMNEPINQKNKINEMVLKGYIVRTRADANTIEARKNDRCRFEASKASGEQIITTDYYLPSSHFKSPYKVSFEENTYIRAYPFKHLIYD
ncbi:MAG: phosphatidylinositol-specific phospholipase C1-like protein [Bacteroidota bacterium]|nr:phosphatidylinositol-specific phospholipase C1-like protein [Bacteroidota bacterium]